MAKYDSQFSRATAIEEDDTIEQFYRPAASSKVRAPRPQVEHPRGEPRVWPDDKDNEDREEDVFLRARRRVPVRRGIFPTSRNGRIFFASSALLLAGALVVAAVSARNFLRSDSRLRINSVSNIQVMGNSQLTRAELLTVFGSDIGRNIFFVPLEERRAELESLPWVGHATVMRLLPNQLRVSIVERVPVAFLRNGNGVGLVDAHGILLNLSPAMMGAKHYSFPVVKGIKADDPLPLRAARMHLYREFIADLDSGGGEVSKQISEVDLSDPEDIRAFLPAQGSSILVHFGESDFLSRYRRYRQHVDEWRRQYPQLASVDMRYDNQAVLEMDKETAVAASQVGNVTEVGRAKPGSKPPAIQSRLKPLASAGKPVKRTTVAQHRDANHLSGRKHLAKQRRKQIPNRRRNPVRSHV